MISAPGEMLIEAARRTSERTVLIAPFVKLAPLTRLVEALRPAVHVDLVTRWRPAEVAAGVSDVAVLDVLNNEGRGRVYLLHDLHAKYYRFDDCAFVGSANLTSKALGWATPPNVELLVANEPLPEFERALLSASRFATAEIAREVQEAADLLGPVVSDADALPHGDERQVRRLWLPKVRQPSDLYVVYAGDSDLVSSASARAATEDLAYLAIPLGLSRIAFVVAVRSTLEGTELFARLERYVDRRRRFGEMRDWIAAVAGLTADEAKMAWQTVLRWLREFFPDRFEYDRPGFTEIIQRKAE
jgi:hypothetical protein